MMPIILCHKPNTYLEDWVMNFENYISAFLLFFLLFQTLVLQLAKLRTLTTIDSFCFCLIIRRILSIFAWSSEFNLQQDQDLSVLYLLSGITLLCCCILLVVFCHRCVYKCSISIPWFSWEPIQRRSHLFCGGGFDFH